MAQPPRKPAPKNLNEVRLHNYLKQTLSSSGEISRHRAVLIHAHNWIFTQQIPVSDPHLHDLLATCFEKISIPDAARFHRDQAVSIRNAARKPRQAEQKNSPAPSRSPEKQSSSPLKRGHNGADRLDAPASANLLKKIRATRGLSQNRNESQRMEVDNTSDESQGGRGSPVKRAEPPLERMDVERPLTKRKIERPVHVEDTSPYDSVDYIKRLKRAVEMIHREAVGSGLRAPTVDYSSMVDESKYELVVSLKANIDIPAEARKVTDGRVTSSASVRFGTGDSVDLNGEVYRKAKNRAARVALESVRDVDHKIGKACHRELKERLEDMLRRWQQSDYSARCYRAFDRTRDMITSSAKGNIYGASVSLYGSVPTGLVLGDSDIDVAVSIPCLTTDENGESEELRKQKGVEVLRYLSRAAKKDGMEKVYVIGNARVPVLRYVDRETQVDVDVTLNNDQSLLLSRLMRKHLQTDRRIWELCMIVKHWAKQRKVIGVPQGHINAMGWMLMVIFFMQHVVVPRIGRLCRTKRNQSRYATIVEVPWRTSERRGRNVDGTQKILIEFFRVFGHEFDFEREAISVNLGERAQIMDVSTGAIDVALFIEQPLARGKNVVEHVSRRNLEIARREMRSAYDVLSAQTQDVSRVFRARHCSEPEALYALS
ncbi:UTP:RNA uridylyltransferase 1 [Gracilariopsis chorda]|uniref:UTP:RNA uridylyltransferase 1 n=1 Tax=Gracilariopsis chorda TaxID=448386 RepID=A0A2V3J450_9FLOR|nr:UTP:RNA uridylyltransferase 1 [Gracilariopsis chorda]|eukprot:PXF48902.1 UTP:RNA uridylyltransferase 1 [Gracilariopsis chorda]